VAGGPERTWLDVGAHLGEKTFAAAREDPSLRVYAFEPNLAVAKELIGRLPNYIVLPMAVAERDGCADLYLNMFAAASSLLPFDPEGLRRWSGGEVLKVERAISVPTIRLDTFLELMGLEEVEFLKIDAQGADLAVVRSAGERLRTFARIALEVQVTPVPLYEGGSLRGATVDYLASRGFELASVEKQSRDQEENLVFVRKAETHGA
jgi:FkbM family methyltransferase